MKVICHAAAPMTATPGFRQYDMLIDGQSFFTMPKVYELGIRGVGERAGQVRSPSSATGGGGYGGYDSPPSYASPPPASPAIPVPRNAIEEEEELQRAINASLEESRKHLEKGQDSGPSGGGGGTDLLDFSGPPAGAPPPALPPSDTYGAPPPNQQSFALAPAPQQYAYPGAPPVPPQQTYPGAPPVPPQASPYQPTTPVYGEPPQQTYPAIMPPGGAPAYGAPPPGQQQPPPPAPASYDATFVPSASGILAENEDPFAPKPPTHNAIASEILSAYASPTSAPGFTTPTAAAPGPNYSQGFQTPQAPASTPGQPLALPSAEQPPQQQPAQNGGMTLSMNGLAQEEEKPKNEFDAALAKLVNIDHIDEPAEQQLKLTMKKQEEEKNMKNKNKSKPKPPVAHQMVGSGATLEQIKQVKPEAPPKEDIMKPPPQLFHPNAAMAGALVVHGQGPPPLQPQGFGVVHGQGYGYAAQAAYPPQQMQQPPPAQPGYGYQYR